jgi:hypothetical protein
MADNVRPSFWSRDRIRPVPLSKLALAVTVGDLLVVVYLVLVGAFLFRHLRAATEGQLVDDSPTEEPSEQINRAA